jgi:uncharacterized membrane protein (UPF0127 family)
VLPAFLAPLLLACATVPIVEVRSADGTLRLRVEVEFARSAEARREGLQGREPLGPDRGLWLVFPTVGEVCIRNEGVGFDIDVIYLDADHRVIAVSLDVPAGEDMLRCELGVASVLEVQAGVALGVAPGDVLEERP